MRALFVVGLLAAGCGTPTYAVIDGKRVERPSVAYASDDFRLDHDRAFPGVFDGHRGVDVSDGTLHGRMCNVDFDAVAVPLDAPDEALAVSRAPSFPRTRSSSSTSSS